MSTVCAPIAAQVCGQACPGQACEAPQRPCAGLVGSRPVKKGFTYMKKALVADDHELVVRFMKDLLSKRGYEVLTAGDGLSALDILRAETPDIMFVDLIMPSITGEKLCQVIRRMPRLKDLYLVVLSGVAVEQQGNLAEMGANACIAKGPLEKMKEQVIAALDQWENRCPSAFKPEIECTGLEDVHLRHPTRELLAIKRHFEVILGGMSEGILETRHGGRIVYANRSAVLLSGMAEEDLLGTDFVKLFCEEDRQGVQGVLDAAKRDPVRMASEGLPVTLNNRHVIVNVLPVEGEGDTAVIVLNDVTETKRLEARVRQIHKIEAIGTLAAGIAHAFNNLLMGIQGNVSVMLMDSRHAHHDRLRKIERQIQSGARLTSRLLAYGRMGKYESRPLDLNQLVRKAVKAFAGPGRQARIHQHLSDDLMEVRGDPGQIDQVLNSLLVNAEEAMPDGGDLTVKTVNTTHAHMKADLYDPAPGNYVLVSVADTGVGMDKETMERIFDPFFTTKEMGRDTGLSLASVYGIIKGHEGYIEVESTKGKGTTVNIYLPAREGKGLEEVAAVAATARGSGTVLLVDDEEIVLEAGGELLEAMGYKVLTATDGEDAVRVYKNNAKDVDIVLFDLVMPKMGGGTLYDRMKDVNPDIKALLTSGFGVDGEAKEILERGCNGFIQKPFTMRELSEKIRGVLDNQGV